MMRRPTPNHIYTGDCLEVMRSWPDASVDHCIADPPFGIASGRGRRSKRGLGWAFSSHVTMQETWDQFTEDEYFRFSLDWLREVCRVVRPNGNILVFGTYHNIYLLGFLLGHVLERRILNSIIWFKPNAQPNITARTLTESTEQIVWAVNETPKRAKRWTFNYGIAKDLNDGKQMRNQWDIPVTSSKERLKGGHPSQKPAALMDRLVRVATEPGDLLLDPFSGSGVLALSALRYRRRFVLIDRLERYARVARSAVERFPDTKRGRILSSQAWVESLSDDELDLLTETPTPQADELDLVFAVPQHVLSGARTRAQVAKVLAYDPRQGPYYADAAIALRLVQTNGRSSGSAQSLELAPLGKQWIKAPRSRRALLQRDIVLSAPITRYLAARLGVYDETPPDLARLLSKRRLTNVLRSLDLSPETARRRAATLDTWYRQVLQASL